MSSEPFGVREEKSYRELIIGSLQSICGVRFDKRDVSFTDECRSKEWGDVVACRVDATRKGKTLLKLYKAVENHIISYDWAPLFNGEFLWWFTLEQSFACDYWQGACADVLLVYKCKEAPEALNDVWYPDYIKSDEWRIVRNRILNTRGYKCERCNSRKNLQIHHLTYERLGKEEDNDLIILCQACHELVHSRAEVHTSIGTKMNNLYL